MPLHFNEGYIAGPHVHKIVVPTLISSVAYLITLAVVVFTAPYGALILFAIISAAIWILLYLFQLTHSILAHIWFSWCKLTRHEVMAAPRLLYLRRGPNDLFGNEVVQWLNDLPNRVEMFDVIQDNMFITKPHLFFADANDALMFKLRWL